MSTQENFIGIYENAYSQDYCDAVIKYYEFADGAGCTMSRQTDEPNSSKLKKDDSVLFLNGELPPVELYTSMNLSKHFNDLFWGQHYKQYADKFSILVEMAKHTNPTIKIQKTLPGGGYHVWHTEVMSIDTSPRLLAWMVYLNDVKEGGETEFLYQSIRVKPKLGTLVIWPSGFTHTHRGNPPLSGNKYIMTGWIKF
jgi:hypothetical protein